jgi:PAS domain S-box-containing protein
MTSTVDLGWDDNDKQAPGWRIERRSVVRTAEMQFFPDQQGSAYEKLLHNLPVMLHAMDGSGRLISANRTWLNTLGYPANEVAGRAFSEFLPPESRSKLVTAIYPRYLVTGECRSEEILMLRRDGSLATVLLSMTAYRGDKGRLERSICILDDISERKLAELTSVRSDQRFKGAFNASIHGMAVVSPTGRIELANAAMKVFLKREDIETSTSKFDELLHRDDRAQFLNGMGDLLRGELTALQQDLRYNMPDGMVAHGATSIYLIKGSKGEIEQLIVQVSDITDRKLINQRLQKVQKMEAVGQLTGGLAHDFNNLLTIIIGNLQLASGGAGSDERSEKRLGEALDAARRGADLTRQLLAFSRQQELQPRDVGVNGLVTGLQTLLSRTIGENIDLKVVTMEGDPRALIDPTQLESSILNLAINARDAMPNGGRLTIETQPVHLDRFYADRQPDVVPGHYVMIAVSDSGVGMSADLLERIFQPFFTTKEAGKGTGLGLSMVYGFIKQSGGHISVYSEAGHGTSVKMYLPRHAASHESAYVAPVPALSASYVAETVQAPPVAHTAQPEAIAPGPASVAGRRPKILVVEDQEAVRAVACGFLEDFGYDVIEAGDGFDALAKLQENPDVDLMFSDVVMPGGMNGFDLAQAAQSLRSDLKVVHTSGYPKGAMVHQDEPRFKEGFIIMKPYRREDLQKIIRDALESQ